MATQAQATSTALLTLSAFSIGDKVEAGRKNVLTLVFTTGDNLDLIFDTQDDANKLIQALYALQPLLA